MATMGIWQEEQKKRLKKKAMKKVDESKFESMLAEEVEVSPFIIENLTNTPIIVHRMIEGKEDLFKVPSKFYGTVRLSDNVNDVENLKFTFFDKLFNISLEHYGIVRIPGMKNYYVEFKIDKLNRIVRFIGAMVIKNCTSSGLYLAIYNQKEEKVGPNLFI